MTKSRLLQALFPTISSLILLAISSTAIARADDLPKGTIIERVVCEADATKSYSLYLPSTYTSGKKWPVIYAFDPSARGDVPVKLYKEAAEKYGYIVAGTYDTQNGMQSAPLQAAISALITDTRRRFSIDEKRVYTSGFSGGARIATRIASSCGGCIAGVIACGAGFPSDIKPSSVINFSFFGTVGVEDYNYPELKRLEETLTSLKKPNYISTFEGEHQWASSQLLIEAVEWMELQAMHDGRRTRDAYVIEALWKKRVDRVRAIESGSVQYDVYVSYAKLVSDFGGLKDVSDYEKKVEAARESREVKQALRQERDQLRDQQEIADRILSLGSRLLTEPTQRASTLIELKSAVVNLKKKSQSTTDTSDRRVVRRALRQVLAQTFEAALYNYLPNRQYDVAIVNLLVAEEIRPELPRIPFELSRAYAVTGEKKMAIEALRRSVEKGMTDATIIESQKDFDAIRNENEFKGIVLRLKQETHISNSEF